MNKNSNKIAIIASTITTAIHIINKIQYSASTAREILSSTYNQYYEWRFGKIRYTKRGNGTPLLLIHDLTVGSSGYEFHKIIDQLSKQFEVYCIDMLGYGLSDKPNITYTSFLYVQLITDFIKTVIGRKTNVIATGDSSSLVVMTCHNNPEVFNKLFFINPQSLYQFHLIPSKKTKALKIIIDTPILGTFIYNIITSKYSYKKLFRKYYYANADRIEKEEIMAYIESSHINDYNSKYSFSSYIGRYMNLNILHSLKEINHSIFIIAGKEKKESESIVKSYLSYNNSIETIYISDTKQYPHLEAPQKVINQLDIFLN